MKHLRNKSMGMQIMSAGQWNTQIIVDMLLVRYITIGLRRIAKMCDDKNLNLFQFTTAISFNLKRFFVIKISKLVKTFTIDERGQFRDRKPAYMNLRVAIEYLHLICETFRMP